MRTVVESSRFRVACVGLERQGVDAFVAQPQVAASEAPEVLDPGDPEPDEVRGVVRHALGVGLGEADGHLVREPEVHRP